MFAWLRRLFRRTPSDNRWWEDGHPITGTIHFRAMGVFERVMVKQFCQAEFDMTVDLTRQFLGDPYSSRWPRVELRGLELADD